MLISQASAYRRKKFRGLRLRPCWCVWSEGHRLVMVPRQLDLPFCAFFGLVFLWDAAGVQQRVSGTVCIE